jgi:4-hydroxybenzoyl-CoA reductase subunit beta
MLRLPAFTYEAPQTLSDALYMKSDHGPDAAFVSGGTDLFPNMKRRQQEPKLVVQVSHLEDLRGFQEDGEGRLTVGAGETLTDVTQNPLVQSRYPVLAEAAGSVATPLIRNMGTLGGNICLDTRCNYYDQTYEWRKAINFCMKKDGEICWVAPGSSVCLAVNSSDTAPVMVALGAEIMLRSLRVQRVVPAGAFFRSDGITYLNKDPDELVTGVRLPSPNGWSATYVKLRRRGSIDFPVLGVAAWIMRDSPRGAVTEARVVLGAVASRPLEVPQAAQALIGRPLSEESIHDAAEAAFRPAKPMDNTDYALSWRKEMVRQFVGKALRRLM